MSALGLCGADFFQVLYDLSGWGGTSRVQIDRVSVREDMVADHLVLVTNEVTLLDLIPKFHLCAL